MRQMRKGRGSKITIGVWGAWPGRADASGQAIGKPRLSSTVKRVLVCILDLPSVVGALPLAHVIVIDGKITTLANTVRFGCGGEVLGGKLANWEFEI